MVSTAQTAVSILFGAIAGGVTNAVAVWMLFHPYEPPNVFGRPFRLFQGAIPKNKARLAAAVGRTVGTQLLTSEDLARTVGQPGFREAFDERLSAFLEGVLEREWGSLSELLPAPLLAELRVVLDGAAEGLLERLDEYLADEEFRGAAHRWARDLADELRDRPLAQLLTPERQADLAARADGWVADVLGGDGFQRAIQDYLDRSAERLLRPGRTFQDLLPQGLVSAVERAIGGYLPLALERLGGMLERPEVHERLERVLHEILNRFMRDLRFHQRLVASLVITPETIDKVLAAIERDGAGKISELLQEPEMRDATARSVNDAIVDFLRRPVNATLGRPGEPSVEEAKDTVSGWVLGVARDEHTRAFLIERLKATLASAEHRTWGDLFRHVPPDRIADALVSAARSERARQVYRETTGRLLDRALDRRIGRPIDLLGEDAALRIERSLAEPLWGWLQAQVPAVAGRVDIAGKVEERILAFPTAKLEALIRNVTEKELRLIVHLGYLLGAMIGLLSALTGYLFR